MIGALLINIIVQVVSFFINLLPNATILPDGFNDAWTWLTDIVASLFWTIPGGGTLLLIFNLVIITEGAIMTWKGIKIIINWLRGSGS